MTSRRTIKVNLLASWVNHGVGLLIGLFLMPFVLHVLGDESYGLWIFINSIAGYSGLLYLGFGQTISRYVADAHARREWQRLNEVCNVILAVYLAMGAVAFGIAGIVAWWAPALYDWGSTSPLEIRLVILILGLNIALSLASSVFGGVLIGLQRFDLVRGTTLVAGLLRLGLTWWFLRSEWGLLTLSIIYLTVTVAENLGNVVLAFRSLPELAIGRRFLKWAALRDCFSFSAFAFLDAVAFRLVDATDTIVIGLLLGSEAIVPYHIGLRLCQFICRPIHYIGGVSMPRAGELHANARHDKLGELAVKGMSVAFLLTAGFFLGAVFFGRTLIETWVGPGYEASFGILLILLGAQVIATPVWTARAVLFGMGEVRLPALMYLTEAVANLALSLVLIKPFGILGVALGTALPVAVFELGVLLPFAMRKLQIRPGRLIREVLGHQFLPLAALAVYSFAVTMTVPLPANWFGLLAVSAGGGAVLGAVWLGLSRIHVNGPLQKSASAESL